MTLLENYPLLCYMYGPHWGQLRACRCRARAQPTSVADPAKASGTSDGSNRSQGDCPNFRGTKGVFAQ